MKHPLEFVPAEKQKRFFFIFLALTMLMFAIFRVLDEPLRTHVAPNGIVSFELARTPEKASQIMASWSPMKATDSLENREKLLFAAFGLGLDYLFMPLYSLALAFGTMLAINRQAGWIKSLCSLGGWGAFIAVLFDAVENFALFQVLLGAYESSYPAIAASCAIIKFGLLIFGLLVALLGSVLPKK
jgi:hypothetical protein